MADLINDPYESDEELVDCVREDLAYEHAVGYVRAFREQHEHAARADERRKVLDAIGAALTRPEAVLTMDAVSRAFVDGAIAKLRAETGR